MLSTDARVALTLRLLGGLRTKQIARASLISEPTVAQQIVRAKRTLSAARVPIEVPERDELADCLASVLELIYLIFNEGYATTAGDDWIRPELIEHALRLGRILAELLPSEPEVHGIVALMELYASRSRARTGPTGEASPAARPGALALGLDARPPPPRHARTRAARARRRAALHAPGSDRRLPRARPGRRRHRLAAHRRALRRARPTHAIAGRRAQPRGRRRDRVRPEAALELVDAVSSEPALGGYHLLPTMPGDLLARLGRNDEARGEFQRAAALTQNSRERAVLLKRIAGSSPRNGG